MATERDPAVLQPTLEDVLTQVTELYERDPAVFAHGVETGIDAAKYPAGRDYLGLILGKTVIYDEVGIDRDSGRRNFSLNDPAFALGAVIGITRVLPRGRFSNISD